MTPRGVCDSHVSLYRAWAKDVKQTLHEVFVYDYCPDRASCKWVYSPKHGAYVCVVHAGVCLCSGAYECF
jgi:hypothetical protein